MIDNGKIVQYLKEIKNYAEENKIPIMSKDGINYLTTFVIKHKISNILEIGTAIGYSSILMALANPTAKITTIERDHDRYLEAIKNVKKFKLEDRITLIYNDALEMRLSEKFDLIFIDAAKGQNMNFFNNYERNLETDGYIITDNINFHGLVDKKEEEIESKNLKQLVRKIKEYIDFLKDNENYTTTFHQVGDGIAVTERKQG